MNDFVKNDTIVNDAYEWFLWFKDECENEGIKDINKIPELIRMARDQNKKYKALKKEFEEYKKRENHLYKVNWDDGHKFGYETGLKERTKGNQQLTNAKNRAFGIENAENGGKE